LRSDLADHYAQDSSDRRDNVGRVAGVLELQTGPVGKDTDAELSIDSLHWAAHSVGLLTQSQEIRGGQRRVVSQFEFSAFFPGPGDDIANYLKQGADHN
jgi:hypothetical protein